MVEFPRVNLEEIEEDVEAGEEVESAPLTRAGEKREMMIENSSVGLKKKLIKQGLNNNWETPQFGDEVTSLMASEDAGRGANRSVDDEIRRGVTTMKKVIIARNKGIKLQVGWNNKGQPVNPNKSTFVGYIGVLARTKVPITISDWRKVSLTTKQIIWDEVVLAFDIDEGKKRFVLSEAGRLACNFRSYLSRVWICDDDGSVNVNPPAQYKIPADEWQTFVSIRTDAQFHQLSQVNQARAKEPEYCYRKSCENSKSETNNPAVRRVVDEMESLSQTNSSLLSENDRIRDDLPAQALKKPEHPGCFGAIGYDVSQKDYCRCTTKPSQEARLTQLREKLTSLNERVFAMKKMTEARMAQGVFPQSHQDNMVSTVSTKFSCTKLSKTWLPEEKKPCLLMLYMRHMLIPTVVVKGWMFNRPEDRSFHTLPLALDCVKVRIDILYVGDATLPHPINDEFKFIRDAVGTFVAWPGKLVAFMHDDVSPISPGKSGRSKQSTIKQGTFKPAIRLGDICEGLDIDALPSWDMWALGHYLMQRMSPASQLIIHMEEEIMGIEFTEYIGRQEIYHLLNKDQIAASVVSVYIKYLYVHYGANQGRFSFLSPHLIAAGAISDVAQQTQHAQYIATAMSTKATDSPLFLAPYNTGGHWLLLAINPNDMIIYYLDSLNGEPNYREDMRQKFEHVVHMFRANIQNRVKKVSLKTIKWIHIKCPKQTNDVDCGFYVMRFMKEIVSHGEAAIPETYFPDCRCLFYSEEQINEVRNEWSQYVLNLAP